MTTTTNNTIPECKGSIPLIFRENRLVFDGYEGNKSAFVLEDIFFNIFLRCVEQRDLTTLTALSCLNKYHYTMFTEFAANQKMPLTEFFEWLLGRCNKIQIGDPEAFQRASALPILCSNFDFLNHVENDAGGVALYYEDLSIRELVKRGKQQNIQVAVCDESLAEDKKLAKKKPQICIFTNGIFNTSTGKTPQDLQVLVEKTLKCQRLTVREALYFALRKIEMSNGKTVVFGQDPWSAYTSTSYGDPTKGRFLVVRDNARDRIDAYYPMYSPGSHGVAGLQSFPAFGY